MYKDYHDYLKTLAVNFISKDKLQFQVQSAPEEAQALLGSNIAFVIGKILNRDPKIIGKEIVELSLKDDFKFTLLQAPSGFINANPSRKYIVEFLNSLEQNLKSDDFFNFDSPNYSLNLKKIIQKTKNEDVKILLSKGKLTSPDILMLIALLGNLELNVNPYLSALKGKENIPWYLEKFRKDSSILKNEIHLSINYSDFLPDLGFRNITMETNFHFKSLDNVLAYQVHSFLTLRSFRKYEDLFSYCLKLVNSFYEYFNHPTFRKLESDQKNACLLGAYYKSLIIDNAISLLARSNISY